MATKQKNCNNCVDAKRRCDRNLPACSRCTKNGLSCAYKKRKVGDALIEQSGGPWATPSTSAGQLSTFDQDQIGLFELPAPAFVGANSNHNMTIVPSDEGFAMRFDSFNGVDSFPPWDDWLQKPQVIDSGTTSTKEELKSDFKSMAPFCENIDLWNVHDPTTTIYHILDRTTRLTSDLAVHACAPFLHRRLYRENTHAAITTCIAMSILYTNRTPNSKSLVFNSLKKAAEDVVNAAKRTSTAEPLEMLARTQALFIYQVIRLFDGDIMLRAQGEKDMSTLLSLVRELCMIRDQNGFDLGTAEEIESKFRQRQAQWDHWIYAESLRRTILLAYSVIGLYTLMKDSDGNEGIDVWSQQHQWTMSRQLWEAKSADEFFNAYENTPRFMITNYELEDFLDEGKGDYVDEFGEILLTVYLGVDAAQKFLSHKMQ